MGIQEITRSTNEDYTSITMKSMKHRAREPLLQTPEGALLLLFLEKMNRQKLFIMGDIVNLLKQLETNN